MHNDNQFIPVYWLVISRAVPCEFSFILKTMLTLKYQYNKLAHNRTHIRAQLEQVCDYNNEWKCPASSRETGHAVEDALPAGAAASGTCMPGFFVRGDLAVVSQCSHRRNVNYENKKKKHEKRALTCRECSGTMCTRCPMRASFHLQTPAVSALKSKLFSSVEEKRREIRSAEEF